MLHIDIVREREKNNICIEIQSHVQHIFFLFFRYIFPSILPIVCAYTSMTTIVMEFYLFCSIAIFLVQITSYLSFLLLSLQKYFFYAMKERDTKNSDNSQQQTSIKTSPIVIKIEAPKEAKEIMKKKLQQQIKNEEKKVEDTQKPTSSTSKCCQFLPILLFLVTFATVLTALIIYMDPSSKFNFCHH